ncbi:MAG: sarcosine oxidase subunit delta [Alphaproteobacteria bacterium]
MRINCPNCGTRPLEEFTIRGDAAPVRPATSDPEQMSDELRADWHAYVYLRDNPLGRIAEYWHHAGGCRAWLVVERDTTTHQIIGVITASAHAKQKASA